VTICQKYVDEQQFSNSLIVPHMLWSELDSGEITGIRHQDQVTRTSCSTWCHSSWFLFIELDKV